MRACERARRLKLRKPNELRRRTLGFLSCPRSDPNVNWESRMRQGENPLGTLGSQQLAADKEIRPFSDEQLLEP